MDSVTYIILGVSAVVGGYAAFTVLKWALAPESPETAAFLCRKADAELTLDRAAKTYHELGLAHPANAPGLEAASTASTTLLRQVSDTSAEGVEGLNDALDKFTDVAAYADVVGVDEPAVEVIEVVQSVIETGPTAAASQPSFPWWALAVVGVAVVGVGVGVWLLRSKPSSAAASPTPPPTEPVPTAASTPPDNEPAPAESPSTQKLELQELPLIPTTPSDKVLDSKGGLIDKLSLEGPIRRLLGDPPSLWVFVLLAVVRLLYWLWRHFK